MLEAFRSSRSVRGVRHGALLALLLGSALPTPARAATVPAQWIAKQYTELLGRAPTPAEWNTRVAFYQAAAACDAPTLAALGKELARSAAFLNAYPPTTPLDRALRLTALVRAAFNHDPNENDWNAFFVPYLGGSATWDQTVDAVYGGVFATFVAPRACDANQPGYGWDYSPPLDVRQRTGSGASRTQAQLQAAIDAAAPGTTVALQPGEVVRIGGAANGNGALQLKAGVTLQTAGAPSNAAYARMGRIVFAGPDANACISFVCNQIGLVQLAPGARVANLWVDGQGAGPLNYKIANVDLAGSSAAAPSSVSDSRISNPGRDGTGIRLRGFATSGTACSGASVQRNLITGYGSAHRFDRLGLPEWADGIAVQCEQASVTANEIVDASDTGILIYGSFNRAANTGAVQRSLVQGNRVLSAGLSAHTALGADAIGDSVGDRDNFVVPALDLPAERSFAGASITGNTFWTSPRTHFDIGIMAGGAPRWGDHRVFGRGLAVTNNTVGVASARVSIGISVLGMKGVTLTGNTASYVRLDTMPASTFGKCPLVNVGVGSVERSSLVAGAQASVVHDTADGCLTPEGPPQGLEFLRPAPGGNGFVGASTGKPIELWGTGVAISLFGDWNEIVENARELRRMGFNSIRVLVQAEDFLAAPATPGGVPTTRSSALARLRDLFALAEQTGLYVDLTGLGIEGTDRLDPTQRPNTWFNSLAEAPRWQAQAIFWRDVAATVKGSPALAFYDLMNEPVLPDVTAPPTYCAGEFADICFAQFITRTRNGRDNATIARQWMTQMKTAISQQAGDAAHMISIGTIFCGGGFELPGTADLIDFQIIHLYPSDAGLAGEIEAANACKKPGFPLVIEETALLATGSELVLESFVRGTGEKVNGHFAQSNGLTPAQLNPPPNLALAFQLGTYRVFLFNAFRANPGGTGAIQP